MDKMIKAETVAKYIAAFPAPTRKLLSRLRSLVKKASPTANEVISYGIPGYKLDGMLVYFAGYRNHIGFYPGASGIREFKNELSAYKSTKGGVQFPLDSPLPERLISRIVKVRVKENSLKAQLKRKK